MPIEIPSRPGGGAPPGLPAGSRVVRGQARPLTGREVADCLVNCLMEAAKTYETVSDAYEQFREHCVERISREAWSNRDHLTWPNVRWWAKVMFREGTIWADLVIQLSESQKVVMYINEPPGPGEFETREIGQNMTDVPDDIRNRWGIGVKMDFQSPDGVRGTVTISPKERPVRDLPKPFKPTPAPPARTADVGRAAQPAPTPDTELVGAPPIAPDVAEATKAPPTGVRVKERK